jgi:hypothetical protein
LKEEYDYTTGLFSPNSVITQSSNLASVFETVVGPKQTRSDLVLFESGLSPKDFPQTSVTDFSRKAINSDNPFKSFLNAIYYQTYSKKKNLYDPKKEAAEVYVDEFLNWSSSGKQPWAACINLMDAHLPYIPRNKHNLWGDDKFKQLQDIMSFQNSISEQMWGYHHAVQMLYDGCIRQADTGLERLLTTLTAKNLLEDTLVVITSDHGESFGERSCLNPNMRLYGHNHGIHEVLTHVPLIVKQPGQTQPNVQHRAATLTNFPKVVRNAIAGGAADSAFVPEEGVVLSSSKRQVANKYADGDQPLPNDDIWRAVYYDVEYEPGVIKHATWSDYATSIHARNAQTAYIVEADTMSSVESTYDGLTKMNVKLGDSEDREMEREIQARLTDLGYLSE